MKVKITDISIFFRSNCCQSSEPKARPCRNSAQIMAPLEYMRQIHQKGIPLHVTTITIGNKRLGGMCIKDQYRHMVKDIKKHIPYHSEQKYIYHFEQQENGNLHAHGLEYDTYQARFHESFRHYGKRNCHPKSFQKLRNFDGYTEYINKENVFPPITNIMKKERREGFKINDNPRDEGASSTEREALSIDDAIKPSQEVNHLDYGIPAFSDL